MAVDPLQGGWERMEVEWWEEIAASLPRPWPREACLMDMRIHHKREVVGGVRIPSYRTLMERWGREDWGTRRIMQARNIWIDPELADSDLAKTSQTPRKNLATTSQKPRSAAASNAENQPKTSQEPRSDLAETSQTSRKNLDTREKGKHLTPTPTPTPEIPPTPHGGDGEASGETQAEASGESQAETQTPDPAPARVLELVIASPAQPAAPSPAPAQPAALVVVQPTPAQPAATALAPARQTPAPAPAATAATAATQTAQTAPAPQGGASGVGGATPPLPARHTPAPGPASHVYGPSVVRVGDKELPGDLPALLTGIHAGRVDVISALAGCSVTTTAELLLLSLEELRYCRGIGPATANAIGAWMSQRWGVEMPQVKAKIVSTQAIAAAAGVKATVSSFFQKKPPTTTPTTEVTT